MQGSEWRELLAGLSFFLGALVFLLGSLGLARLPDLYARSHALGKSLTLGLALLLLALWLHPQIQASGLKIAAAIIFQFIAMPVASHLLMQAARRREIRKP